MRTAHAVRQFCIGCIMALAIFAGLVGVQYVEARLDASTITHTMNASR